MFEPIRRAGRLKLAARSRTGGTNDAAARSLLILVVVSERHRQENRNRAADSQDDPQLLLVEGILRGLLPGLWGAGRQALSESNDTRAPVIMNFDLTAHYRQLCTGALGCLNHY